MSDYEKLLEGEVERLSGMLREKAEADETWQEKLDDVTCDIEEVISYLRENNFYPSIGSELWHILQKYPS